MPSSNAKLKREVVVVFSIPMLNTKCERDGAGDASHASPCSRGDEHLTLVDCKTPSSREEGPTLSSDTKCESGRRILHARKTKRGRQT